MFKKLIKETNKLDQIVYASKILSLLLKTKTKPLKRIYNFLKRNKKGFIQNSSISNKDDETDMYNSCGNLKNEIFGLKKYLSSSPREETTYKSC